MHFSSSFVLIYLLAAISHHLKLFFYFKWRSSQFFSDFLIRFFFFIESNQHIFLFFCPPRARITQSRWSLTQTILFSFICDAFPLPWIFLNFRYIYSSFLVIHLIFLCIYWFFVFIGVSDIKLSNELFQHIQTCSNKKQKEKKRPESLFSGVIRSKTPIISDNRYYPAD